MSWFSVVCGAWDPPLEHMEAGNRDHQLDSSDRMAYLAWYRVEIQAPLVENEPATGGTYDEEIDLESIHWVLQVS